VAVTDHVAAALGKEAVTTAMAFAAELLVICAPPPTIFPVEHVAVAVTVAPTTALPANATAVPVTIVTFVGPVGPVAPVKPVGPVGPCDPVAPVGP
jgi:hypothetical protein